LIRHSTAYSFYAIVQGLLSLQNVGYWLKILYLYVFRNFRDYGVIVFVYVGAIEQTMLFESILQYIINATVVLLVAELDELLFISLAKSDITSQIESEGGGGSRRASVADSPFDRDTAIEEGSNPLGRNDTYERTNTYSSRANRVNHTISDFTQLKLSPKEQEAFDYWDFGIVRANFLSMIVPLMAGKLTGKGCSENSFIRVSEWSMLCLILSRVLLNVKVDMLVDRKFSYSLKGMTKMLWSLLEHGIPAYLYLVLMYAVFVVRLKPPTNEND
jgi:hypothetical protein